MFPSANSISNKSVSSRDVVASLQEEIRDKNTANTDFVLIYGESKVIAL